jgi:hypothetical protein
MIVRAVAAAAAVALISTAALADPVGRYTIRGTNPGSGSTYSGEVAVTKTGDTYRVVWNVGGQTYTGTGIGSDNFLAVSYRSGNETGLALYGRKSDGTWQGVWTYAGGNQIGTDLWTPR